MYRLNLQAIEHSLKGVKREFPKINEIIQSRRDTMTDEVVENMMAGYAVVSHALYTGVDLLDLRHVKGLLELNHIVLCGLAPESRQEHRKHIEATIERFYQQDEFNIEHILPWYAKHSHQSPWKRAAGVYIRVLSQPQLYIEGNHRTGALIMSYILARDGEAPFVLSVDNAKAYFDPSTLIKETKKSVGMLLTKMPRMKARFAKFLQAQANKAYLCPLDAAVGS
jgi:hypothetical protein